MLFHRYLIQQKQVEISNVEKDLPTLCLRHLNSAYYDPDLKDEDVKTFVLHGYYPLIEYAVVHWIDHVRSYVSGSAVTEPALTDITSILSEFCNTFWDPTSTSSQASPSLEDAVLTSEKDLQNLDLYDPELFRKLVDISSLTLQLCNSGIEVSSGPLPRLERALHKV